MVDPSVGFGFKRLLRGVTSAVAAVGLTVSAQQLGPPALADAPSVTSADISFAEPGLSLRYSSARQVIPAARYIDQIQQDITRFLRPSPSEPVYPGAVALAVHDGVILAHDAVGYALRYLNDTPTDIPPDQWIPMQRNTIFDLASMTKLFTSIAAVQLIEEGRIALDAPVTRYIPEFAANGKSDITMLNLLTHTSGLPPDPKPRLCEYPTREQQWAAVYAVEPATPPNQAFLYSDMNMMTLGKVIESVTGRSLDRVIARKITEPLRMSDTMYNPPSSLKPRIAAEEYQPWTGRGIVWGSVHDENAYCVGGVSGHAGVFSTANDVAVLAQTLLNGGQYKGTRILEEQSVRTLFTDYNQAFPGHAHGLGFELDQRRYMGALSSPVTAGHTGFAGTSVVIDPLAHSFMILLTNRVHPSRSWGADNPPRAAVATDLAMVPPVRPTRGRTAWFAGPVDDTTATLTVPVTVSTDGADLSFDLWYDTSDTDGGAVHASSDGGATWQLVPLSLRAGRDRWQTDGTFTGFEGRQWLQATAQLNPSTTHIRWTYTTGSEAHGRGVYVDAVTVAGDQGLIFDDSRRADAAEFQPENWVESRS
ncbi:beta-lactamase family protein [Microbacterium sp. HD4P20]|uniref:serine hydrolase domain-containing protein n=1 Tax=Microbacterium sp. HD4P20 TaxID=2864874 RepID=UPI0020A48817|nr:serine hydrolase domain-containing protein [Microbacterium sp. HD4P20]MCP2635206.1 beta-lactamase family protein [Microbacterium sp. HD4P20]